MLKIAHFADLHASEKTRDEAIKALKFIFDTCRERQVHAIIDAGDTWDGVVSLGEKGPVNEIMELMNACPAPMYMLQGTPSHDIPGAIDIFEHIGRFNGQHKYMYTKPDSFGLVKTPPDQDVISLLGEAHPAWNLDEGAAAPCGHISFLPAPTKAWLAQNATGSLEEVNQIIQGKLREILAGFAAKAVDSPRPHILVAHITVSGSETSTGQTLYGGDINVSVADLALADADYVALGHIHKAQQPNLPPNIHYAGSPYHLNFGELEPKGFKIVTFDDDGKLADVEFVETPSRPRAVIDVHIEDGKLQWSGELDPRADTRVRIHGTAHELTDDLVKQVEQACEGVHSLRVEKITTPERRVRAAELTNAKTLRDKLTEYAKVREIKIPETALNKADRLEEMA